MASDQFSCPECAARLRRSPHLRPGVRVQCPTCKTQFAVPDEVDPEPPPAPPPPRRADYEADTPDEDRRRSAVRRDDDLPPPPPRRESFDRPPGRYDDEDDYDDRRLSRDDSDIPTGGRVELNQWLGYAKQHWGQILGPAVGFIVLFAAIYFPLSWILGALTAMLMITGSVPFEVVAILQQAAGAFLSIFVAGPLYSGMTYVCLAEMKGKRWSFGDFFAGVRYYPSMLGLSAINYLLLVPLYLVQIGTNLYTGMGMRGGPMGPLGMGGGDEIIFIALAFQLAWLVAYLFLYIRLMVFAQALIFDRGLGPIEAVKASWKMSEGQFFPLLGVVIVLGLINFAGAIPCGIGLLFTLPFTGLAYAAGYLIAVGRRPVSLEYSDEDYGPRRRDYDEDDRPRRRNYDEYDDRPPRRDDDDDDDRRRGDYRR